MTDKAAELERLKKDITKNEEIKPLILKWAKWLVKNPKYLPFVWKELNDSSNKKAWRFAYLIDNVNDIEPKYLKKYLPKMIDQLAKLNDHSIRRHFTRILSKHPVPDNEELQSKLLNFCFSILLRADIKVAVKVHCIVLCEELCKIYPELTYEFCSILQKEMENNSSAFKVRARRILNQHHF